MGRHEGLPATLVIRPFNFDTLATQAHTLAARRAVEPTAALIIVAVGLLPMFWISRQILRVSSRGAGEGFRRELMHGVRRGSPTGRTDHA